VAFTTVLGPTLLGALATNALTHQAIISTPTLTEVSAAGLCTVKLTLADTDGG